MLTKKSQTLKPKLKQPIQIIDQEPPSRFQRQVFQRAQPQPIFSLGNGVSSTQEQIFALSLGAGQTPFSKTDPTVLFAYNIPVLIPNQKKRLIQITFLGAFLKDYSSHQFPSKLGLKLNGVQGFKQMKETIDPTTGQSTWSIQYGSIVAWANMTQMTQIKGNTGISTYNVIYQNQQDVTWDIGMTEFISFQIVDDKGQPQPGPFNNPVQLQMRILHVAL